MTKELKTLNELVYLFSERKRLEKEFLDWAKENKVKVCPMSVIGWIENKIKERDKRETIKWVKELNKYATDSDYVGEIIPPDILGEGHCSQCDAIVLLHFLKYFFNVTEADLK